MQEQNEARGFTVRQIEGELKRLRRKQNSRRIFRQTVFSLLVVAAVAVLATGIRTELIPQVVAVVLLMQTQIYALTL